MKYILCLIVGLLIGYAVCCLMVGDNINKGRLQMSQYSFDPAKI